jgi:hypothetical protein
MTTDEFLNRPWRGEEFEPLGLVNPELASRVNARLTDVFGEQVVGRNAERVMVTVAAHALDVRRDGDSERVEWGPEDTDEDLLLTVEELVRDIVERD